MKGTTTISIPNWAKIREKILERDRRICRICLKDYDLHVHHIDYNRRNNEDDNLVTLCTYCHRAVHKAEYGPWCYDGAPPPWDRTKPIDDSEYNQEYSW